MEVTDEDLVTMQHEDERMLSNLDKIYDKRGVRDHDVNDIVKNVLSALVAVNEESSLTPEELQSLPAQFLNDDNGIKQAGIDNGFLSENFMKKMYPGGFPDGFQFAPYRHEETNSIVLDKHLFNQEEYNNDISQMQLEEWKVSDEDVKSVYDMVTGLAKTKCKYTRLEESLKNRDGDTLDELRDNRLKLREESETEEELNAIDMMGMANRELFKHKHTLDIRLCNIKEPDSADIEMEDTQISTKCPLTQTRMKNAAKANCQHRYEYDNIIAHYKQKKKRKNEMINCPVPGCISKFREADVTQDSEYQNAINAQKRRKKIAKYSTLPFLLDHFFY